MNLPNLQGARHTYAEAVGKNVANPTAMMLCAAKMLNHVNLKDYGDMIRNAINRVLTGGKVSAIFIIFSQVVNRFVRRKCLKSRS